MASSAMCSGLLQIIEPQPMYTGAPPCLRKATSAASGGFFVTSPGKMSGPMTCTFASQSFGRGETRGDERAGHGSWRKTW